MAAIYYPSIEQDGTLIIVDAYPDADHTIPYIPHQPELLSDRKTDRTADGSIFSILTAPRQSWRIILEHPYLAANTATELDAWYEQHKRAVILFPYCGYHYRGMVEEYRGQVYMNTERPNWWSAMIELIAERA